METGEWTGRWKVVLALLVALMCVGCHGDSASESGSGMEPFPVTALNISVDLSNMSFTVSWEDYNMGDVTFNVSYTIIVGTITLSSDSLVRNITMLVVPDDAVVPGVTVRVSVQVSSSMGLMSNLTVESEEVSGDFAPMAVNFSVVQASLMGGTPAVTLTWDNRFDSVPPSEFRLIIIPENSPNSTKTLLRSETASSGFSDHLHVVDNLNFFTNYTFVLSPVYNVTGSEVEGDSVNINHTTEEGAPSPVGNLTVVFDEESPFFNSTSQTLLISVTISWEEPDQLNGVLQEYLVTFSPLGGEVLQNLTTSALTVALSSLSLSPFTEYVAVVTANTGGGNSTANVTARSPETDPTPPRNVILTLDNSSAVYDPINNSFTINATVSWSPPSSSNGALTGFEVKIICVEGFLVISNITVNTSTNTLTLTVIVTPYQFYFATITAVNGAGSATTNSATVVSPQAAPYPVTIVVVTFAASRVVFNSNSQLLTTVITIEWVRPVCLNGPNVIYFLIVRHNTTGDIVLCDTVSDDSVNVTVNSTVQVRPFENYDVIVVAGNDAGNSTQAATVARSPEAASSPPLNVSVSIITSTSALVSWEEPANANGEIQFYNLTVSSGSDVVIVGGVVNTSVSISLKPFTQYSVTVRAVHVIDGEMSVPINFTSAEDVPSGSPGVPMAIVRTPSSITLNWTEIDVSERNGVITSYVIQYGEGATRDRNLSTNSSVTNHTVVNLNPFTNYTFAVAGVNSIGTGPFSTASDMIRTAEDIPGPVRNLSLSHNGSSFLILWVEPDDPNGQVSYLINLTCTDLFRDTTTVLLTLEETSSLELIVVETLLPYSNCSVTVTPLTSAGQGSTSSQTLVSEEEAPSVVPSVTVSEVGGVILLSWSEPMSPNGDLQYNISLEVTDLFLESVVNSVSFTTRERELNTSVAVQPYFNYTATVVPFTSPGPGPSTTGVLTTDQEAPSAPLQVILLPLSPEAVSVSWSPPSMPNGVITSYEVTYFATESGRGNATTLNTTGQQLSLNVTGLKPFTNYTVVVAAVTVAVGSESDQTTVLTEEAAPSEPQNLELFLNRTHLVVTWDPPLTPNGVVSYSLNISSTNLATGIPAQLQRSLMVDDDGSREVTIQINFEPYVQYVVFIQAMTGGGASQVVMATMTSAEDAPSVPLNLSLNLTSTSISARWDTPTFPNGVVSYQINISGIDLATGDPSPLQETLFRNDTFRVVFLEFTFDPYVRYTVSILAMTGGGVSAVVLETIISEEGVSMPPEGLSIEPTNTSVNATWLPPSDANGVVVFYTAFIALNSSTLMVVNTSSSSLTVVFDDLKPFTNYSVVVRAVTGGGRILGDIAMVDVTTLVGVPSAPRSVMPTPGGVPEAITVSWQPPEQLNSPSLTYIVMVATGDSSRSYTTKEDQLQISVMGLRPFTRYNVSVQACSFVGCSLFSMEVLVTTLQGAPSAPTSFSLSTVPGNSTALAASWMVPRPPNGILRNYTVVCNDTLEFVVVAGDEINLVSTSLTGLTAFSVYECFVFATTDGGQGNSSELSVAMTAEDIPGSPLMFVLEMVLNSSSTLSASWSPPNILNGILLGYNISCTSSRSEEVYFNVSAMTTTHLLTNLTPFTNYSCTVSARTAAGEGPPSNSSGARTDEDVAEAPENLTVVRITATSVAIMWEEPVEVNGILAEYQVRVGTESNVANVFTVPSNLTSFEALSLQPFTNYTLEVAAVNGVGSGNVAMTTVITSEAAPTAPLNLILTASTSTSIAVSWATPSMPNGIIRSYRVSVYQSDGVLVTEVEVNGTSAVILGLQPFTNYSVNVSAMTVAEGPSSNTETIQTLEDAPSPPTDVMVTALSSEAITVTWSPPSMPNGVITLYQVIYYLTLNGGRVTASTLNTSELQLNVTGLQPFTNYTVIVVAETIAVGNESDPFTVVTGEAAPSEPHNLMLFLNRTVLRVTWDTPLNPNGMLSYNLTISITVLVPGSSTQQRPPIVNTVGGNEQEFLFMIAVFEPYVRYTVSLQAVTGGGVSDVVMGNVTSEEAAPSAPLSFVVSTITNSSTSLSVIWQLPSSPNGVILNYIVSCLPVGSLSINVTLLEVEASNVNGIITGLSPFTNYTCSVTATTQAGESPPSNSDTAVTDESTPGPVVSLAVMVVNSTSIRVSWQRPSTPNGIIERYVISITEQNSDQPLASQTVQATSEAMYSVTIVNLTAFTSFAVTVFAFTGVGRGEAAIVMIITDPDSAGPPSNFMAAAVNSTAVNLTWGYPEDPRGEIVGYVVTVDDRMDMDMLRTENITLDPVNSQLDQFLLVDGLKPFTTYHFAVYAYSFGFDPFIIHEGGVATTTAMTDQAAPSAPLNLRLSPSEDPTVIFANWSAPNLANGIIGSYSIVCNDSLLVVTVDAPFAVLPGNPDVIQTSVTNLMAFTVYECVVFASTGAGRGPDSDPNVVTTAEAAPSAPGNVIVTVISSTSVTVTWDPPSMPSGVIRSYQVMYTSDSFSVNLTVPFSETSAVLENLTPFTDYSVTVAATTVALGDFSPVVMVTTFQDTPGPVSDLQAVELNSTAIEVSWAPPTMTNGIILNYSISLSRFDTLVRTVSVPHIGIQRYSTIFFDLMAFTKYNVTVLAFTSVGGGVANSQTVMTDPFAASPPQNLSVDLVMATSVRLMWSYPDIPRGIIRGYLIKVDNDQPMNFTLPVPNDDSRQMTVIDNLLPFVTYSLEVRAYSNDLDSSFPHTGEPATIEVTTAEAAPSAPSFFTISEVVGVFSMLLASWTVPDPANGLLQNYTITCAPPTPTPVVVAHDNSIMNYSVRLEGLLPFTSYSCSIQAATNAGTGNASDVDTARTAEDAPSAPLEVNATANGSMVIQVGWVEPQMLNGLLRGYQVTYNSSEEFTFVKNVSGSDTVAVLDNLRPFTRYSIQVAGFTVALGLPSQIVMETTLEDVPPPPTNFAVNVVPGNPDMLVARWLVPSPPNGILQDYTVTCQPSGSLTLPADGVANPPGTEVTANLISLLPYTVYSCSVVARTNAGTGGESNMDMARTDEAAPSIPRDLLLSLNRSHLVVMWTAPLSPNGKLSYLLNVSGTNLVTEDPAQLQTSINITGDNQEVTIPISPFEPYVRYVVSLLAMTGGGTSMIVMANETSEQDPPSGAPINLAVIARGTNTLNLSWGPPAITQRNGILLDYFISYFNSMGSVVNKTTPFTEYQLTDLDEFTVYNITVMASTVGGAGPGASTQGTTLSTVPGQVVIVSFAADSNTSLTLTWAELPVDQHNGILSGHNISLTDFRANSTVYFTANSSTSTYTFTDLTPFTKYEASIVAVNMNGTGPVSTSDTVTTLEGVPGTVRSLTLGALDYATVSVSWSPPDPIYGTITYYTVGYQISGSEDLVSRTVDPSYLSVNLTGLRGNSQYMVTVWASTSAGTGMAESRMVGTPTGPPVVVPVENFTSIQPVPSGNDAITPTSIAIEFEIVPEQEINGEVDRYLIIVGFDGSNNDVVTTYYESRRSDDTLNRPPYRAVENKVTRSNGRKRQMGGATQSVTLGMSVMCGPEDFVCNGPLIPDTAYTVQYTLFTATNMSQTYSFNQPLKTAPMTTPPPPEGTLSPGGASPVGIAVGVVLGIVIVGLGVALALVVFYWLYKRKSGVHEIYKPSGKRNKNTLSLLIAENQPRLEPTEHTIVPLHENMSESNGQHKLRVNPNKPHSRKIYLKDFERHLQYMLNDSMYRFSEEYERISEIGLDHAKESSLQADNRAKNRYTNILAYDHSRVKLSFVDDDPGSDYINACYIPGYHMKRAYIATQGPLPSTFDDFWRMVWEQNTHVIVMITQLVERGRTKCHRYWPGSDPVVYGEIEVELKAEKDKEDWVMREFKLSIDEKRYRIVRHFQFTSWPDHGVPDSPVAAVDFVKNIRCYVDTIHGPIVVHCSAGVGRSGCFIALDTLLQHIKDHDWVDIFGLACEMRQHRNHMIQTEAQYVFIHKALFETMDLMKGGTTGSHYSQGYTPVFMNRYTDPNDSQMTDYFGNELSITEETHV